MCRYILLLTLTLFLSCNDEKREVVKATTPNILVIIADGMMLDIMAQIYLRQISMYLQKKEFS
mgnify:CR=1 FL=1